MASHDLSTSEPSFPAVELYRIAKLVISTLDIHTALDAIVDAAQALTAARSTTVLLVQNGDYLVVHCARGAAAHAVGERLSVAAGAIGQALIDGRLTVIHDLESEPLAAVSGTAGDHGTFVVAPLMWRGDALGALTLAAPDRAAFTEADYVVIGELAEHAAAAVGAVRARSDADALQGQVELFSQWLGDAHQRLVETERSSAILRLVSTVLNQVNARVGSLKALAAQAHDDAGHVAELLRSLALLTRPADSGPVVAVNLEELLDASVVLAEEVTGRGAIVREFGGVPSAWGHVAELASVFVQLLARALGSLEGDDGVVRVTTALEDGEIVVRVADSGVGIATEHLPRNFEPLSSSPGTGTLSADLASCERVVTRCGGVMDIQSARGSGTTVTVRLIPAV